MVLNYSEIFCINYYETAPSWLKSFIKNKLKIPDHQISNFINNQKIEQNKNEKNSTKKRKNKPKKRKR